MPESRSFTFIEHADQLAAFAEAEFPVVDGGPIALDIEEDREHRFHPSVALIQVTVEDRDYVLDPLTLPRRELAAVIEFLCLATERMVMHGCRNDVTGLKRDFGVGPRVVCDTQMAARFLGADAFGLAALLRDRTGVELDKAVRRSNWLKRPLSEKQLEYAREDTAYLLPLWDELSAEATAAGWQDALDEECAALATLPSETATFDAYGWRRAKGSKQLSDEQKLRAAAVWQWRQEVAEERDDHPSRLLPPWAVVLLAKRGSRAVAEGTAKGVPSNLTDDQEDRLIEALDHPPKVPLRPPRAPRRAPSSNVSSDVIDVRMNRLNDWRQATCEALGLDPGFLAPRSVLEAVARFDGDSVDGYLEESPEIRRWRVDRWGDEWWKLR